MSSNMNLNLFDTCLIWLYSSYITVSLYNHLISYMVNPFWFAFVYIIQKQVKFKLMICITKNMHLISPTKQNLLCVKNHVGQSGVPFFQIIFGPVQENGNFRRQYNLEVDQIYGDANRTANFYY